MFKQEAEEYEERKNNPFAKKKGNSFPKKRKFVHNKPDLKKGLGIAVADEEGLDYDEFGGKTREVTRSMLVKQHDRATLLSYKPKTRNHKPETRKSNVSELARKLWRSFPRELKEELRRVLKDSDNDGCPDAFE